MLGNELLNARLKRDLRWCETNLNFVIRHTLTHFNLDTKYDNLILENLISTV